MRSMNRHRKLLDEARVCSLLSTYEKYKIGSVLLLKSGKRFFGHNQPKSHPLQSKFSIVKKRLGVAKKRNSFLHAEMHAIATALRHSSIEDLKGASIYVFRTPLDKREHAMCRPCVSCMAAIKHFGIKNVYYTSDDSDFVHEVLS